MVALSLPYYAEAKSYAKELYDPESRPALVQKGLLAVGAEMVRCLPSCAHTPPKRKHAHVWSPELTASFPGDLQVLTPEQVELAASLTTLSAIKEKKSELSTLAAPYLEKTRTRNGRKELITEASELVHVTSELASNKLIKPASEYASQKYESTKEQLVTQVIATRDSVKEKVAARLAPRLDVAKEYAAPYLAKLESKRDELTGSKRYEQAMAALSRAREHPAEVAGELRSKAVDLIAYENLKTYRDHVLSEEFQARAPADRRPPTARRPCTRPAPRAQLGVTRPPRPLPCNPPQADTVRLVKVELPALAATAATRARDTAAAMPAALRTRASSLATELETTRQKMSGFVSSGYEIASSLELETLRTSLATTSGLLLAEVTAEATDGYKSIRADGFSIADTLGRLRRIAAAVDKIVITPGRSYLNEQLETYLPYASSASYTSASEGAPSESDTDEADREIGEIEEKAAASMGESVEMAVEIVNKMGAAEKNSTLDEVDDDDDDDNSEDGP